MVRHKDDVLSFLNAVAYADALLHGVGEPIVGVDSDALGAELGRVLPRNSTLLLRLQLDSY